MSVNTTIVPSSSAATAAPINGDKVKKSFHTHPAPILLKIAKEFLEDDDQAAFVRVNKKCQGLLRIDNQIRNALLRFVKARVIVSQPHKSGKHLCHAERKILAKAPLALDLSGIHINKNRIAKLIQAFPQITALNLDDTLMNDKSVANLNPLNKTLLSLSVLSHNFDPCGVIPYITTEGIKKLSEFVALKKLAIGGYHVRTEDLVTLASLTQLEHLTLFDDLGERGSVSISDDLIKEFAKKMPNLNTLIIRDWNITTQAVEAIAFMKNLQELHLLNGTGFTDTMTDAIASIPNLQRLHLPDTKGYHTFAETLLKKRAEKIDKNSPPLTITFVKEEEVAEPEAAAPVADDDEKADDKKSAEAAHATLELNSDSDEDAEVNEREPAASASASTSTAARAYNMLQRLRKSVASFFS